MSDLCNCKRCIAVREAIRTMAEQAKLTQEAHDVCKAASEAEFTALRDLIIKTFKNTSDDLSQVLGMIEDAELEAEKKEGMLQ